jgi:hypothetical protein
MVQPEHVGISIQTTPEQNMAINDEGYMQQVSSRSATNSFRASPCKNRR